MPRTYNTKIPRYNPGEVVRRLHEEYMRQVQIRQNEIKNWIRLFNSRRNKYAR